jgi:hypothetical protein
MTEAEARTRAWVEKVVVGLGLCPFAAAPLRAGRVRIAAIDAPDSDTVYRGCLGEMLALVEADPAAVETTLVVVPAALATFEDYLDMLWILEDAVADAGLEGVLQVASFHPDYCFEGAEPDDPANYTNRSPYPMFHLIREAGLEVAVADHPDPGGIPERNARLLRGMGLAGIRRLAGF